MRPLTFDRFAEELATKRGGYTLWIGAGAAKALCPTMPMWKELEDALASGVKETPPTGWEHRETPARLDWIAGRLGHQAFRRTLRERIVGPMKTGSINANLADAMAVVGARAASLVSFNIESVSALPFIAMHGGAVTLRPYLRPHNHVLKNEVTPGYVAPPIFFPHGLLDISGDCVMTESEYKIHGMSLAVNTAVSLCLGGDLLILGMSLGDRYLRDAILQQRRWFRQVFWVSRDFEHLEWARAAGVHCIEVDYSRLWTGLSEAILHACPQEQLGQWWNSGVLKGRATQLIDAYRNAIVVQEAKILAEADKLAAKAGVRAKELVHYARHLVDFGLELPPSIVGHPEWTGAIDWKEDDIG